MPRRFLPVSLDAAAGHGPLGMAYAAAEGPPAVYQVAAFHRLRPAQGPGGSGGDWHPSSGKNLADGFVREESAGPGDAGAVDEGAPTGGAFDAGQGLDDIQVGEGVQLSSPQDFRQLQVQQPFLVQEVNRCLGERCQLFGSLCPGFQAGPYGLQPLHEVLPLLGNAPGEGPYHSLPLRQS